MNINQVEVSSLFEKADIADFHGNAEEFIAKNAKPIEENQTQNQTGEYHIYEKFLREVTTAKKCIFSKQVLDIKHDFIPLLSRLESLQSYCIDIGLPHTKLKFHLHRYIEELPPERLVEIPKWDGHDHIGELCSHIKFKGEDQNHGCEFLSMWLVNSFRKVRNPRYQNYCPILSGGQEIGKDTFVKTLCSGLGYYLATFNPLVANLDEVKYQVATRQILHIEEFDQTNRIHVAVLKSLITSDVEEIRIPWERSRKRRPMFASFISTVNFKNVFRDPTGNRRFVLLEIDSIDWSYRQENGDQIAAQALALSSTDIKLSEEARKYMKDKIRILTPDDPMDSLFEIFDERTKELMKSKGVKELTLKDIGPILEDLRKIFGFKQNTILSALKVSRRGYRDSKANTARYKNLR